MIEIFDSLAHPTVDESWLNPRFNDNCSLRKLLGEMPRHGIKGAFAVGLAGVGGYSPESFMRMLKPHPQLVPVAFCNVAASDATLMGTLKALGYKGIKIHPRLSKIAGDDTRIFDCIRQANRLGLRVLYCGFLGATEKFAAQINDERLIFLHCGGKNFHETFNLLRYKNNILLDLSYTLTNMPEFTEEISVLLERYPERFCVGSDYPEVSLSTVRQKFEYVTRHLSLIHKGLVGHGNIENFLHI